VAAGWMPWPPSFAVKVAGEMGFSRAPSIVLPRCLLVGVAVPLVTLSRLAGAAGIPRPRLHALSYADALDVRLTVSVATAEYHGFFPVVLGYGVQSKWATGLSNMANLIREYIFNRTQPEDLVLFFDAFDVMFLAGEHEIVDRYLQFEERTKRFLVYNGEVFCTSPRKIEYPVSSSPFRFLNSGIYIGRSRVLRKLFENRLPEQIVDKHGLPQRLQNWHTDFYLDHQDEVAVDTSCEITQTAFGVENVHVSATRGDVASMPGGYGLRLVENRLYNSMTNTTPIIAHFPGWGHWPDWKHPTRLGTCTLYEMLRAVGHPPLARLLESKSNTLFMLGYRPWKAICSDFHTQFDIAAMRLAHFGDNVLWYWHQTWYIQVALAVAICGAKPFLRRCMNAACRYRLSGRVSPDSKVV